MAQAQGPGKRREARGWPGPDACTHSGTGLGRTHGFQEARTRRSTSHASLGTRWSGPTEPPGGQAGAHGETLLSPQRAERSRPRTPAGSSAGSPSFCRAPGPPWSNAACGTQASRCGAGTMPAHGVARSWPLSGRDGDRVPRAPCPERRWHRMMGSKSLTARGPHPARPPRARSSPWGSLPHPWLQLPSSTHQRLLGGSKGQETWGTR